MKSCVQTLKTGIFSIIFAVIMIAVFAFVDKNTVMTAKAADIPKPELCTFYEAKSDHDTIGISLNDNYISSYNIEIYRSASKNGSYSLLDTIKKGSTKGTKGKCTIESWESYDSLYITSVPVNKKYYYKIRLSDSSGNKGPYSGIKSYKLVFSGVSMNQCSRTSSTSAKLSWREDRGASGYEIYRKASGGKWKKVKTIKKGSKTTYTDKKLKSGKTYKYRIRSYVKVKGGTKKSTYTTVTVKAKATVSGSYNSSTAYGNISSQSKRNRVRVVVQNFKDNFIKKGMTKVEKLAAVYNYLRSNCKYSTTSANRQTAYGALVEGKANCSGFSYAAKAMCDALGINCRYVKSNSKSKIDHRWNEVKVGNKWYIFDTQSGGFLIGSERYKNRGFRWNTKDYPTVSKKDYKVPSNIQLVEYQYLYTY